MAIYHKHLQYHEDTVSKKPLTEGDIRFLQELQKELNTQDTCGNASPRFWVIRGTEKQYCAEDGEGTDLIDPEYGCVAEDMESAARYIEYNLENIHCIEVCRDGSISVALCDDGQPQTPETLEDMCAVANWLEAKLHKAYYCRDYVNVKKIYPGTMFLTQKDAEEHLKTNYYHYSVDAHTYAMTAWRSPRVERLLQILQQTDWRQK